MCQETLCSDNFVPAVIGVRHQEVASRGKYPLLCVCLELKIISTTSGMISKNWSSSNLSSSGILGVQFFT